MMDGLVTTRDGAVAIVRLARPPHNFFDAALLAGLADVLTANDADPSVRVTLLTAEGRSFCAGADFSRAAAGIEGARAVYVQAARLFARAKPLVAAVGGPAVGGGLGLALVADFRVVSSAARFHANFAAIGLHPGFAITATLPALVGAQRARDLLTTARRVGGEEASLPPRRWTRSRWRSPATSPPTPHSRWLPSPARCRASTPPRRQRQWPRSWTNRPRCSPPPISMRGCARRASAAPPSSRGAEPCVSICHWSTSTGCYSTSSTASSPTN
jgi:hypothetical protein